jgi:hypothetical protein
MSNDLVKRKNNINRRQFIIKSAIGVCGLSVACGTAKVAFSSNKDRHSLFQSANSEKIAIPPYNEEVLFLSQHQYELVATLSALIIPTDDEPGATEARVVDHIDRLTAASETKQKLYSRGCRWLDKFCQEKYDRGFMDLTLNRQMEIMSLAYNDRAGRAFFQRFRRKLTDIWDGVFAVRMDRKFLREIYNDTVEGFYANPVSWQQVGYFGPPNPVGYPDFSEPPSAKHYSGAVRLVDNVSCNTCHEVGEHPRGGLIDHTCTSCHRPHSPWPYDKSSFYLEDHIGAVFSNPDREKREVK